MASSISASVFAGPSYWSMPNNWLSGRTATTCCLRRCSDLPMVASRPYEALALQSLDCLVDVSIEGVFEMIA